MLMETTIEPTGGKNKPNKTSKVIKLWNWIYRNNKLTSNLWNKHETRILYLIDNLIKNEDTKCMSRVITSVENDALGISIILNPKDTHNEAIVIYKVDGTVSRTVISNYAFDELSKLVTKEITTRLFEKVRALELQEKLKLKEITNSIYGNIDG